MNRWWLHLARYGRAQSRGLAVLVLLTLVGVGLGALAPWPLKLVIDHALAGDPLPPALAWLAALPGAAGSAGLIGWLAASSVLLFLVRQAATSVRTYVQVGVGSRMSYQLGADLFEHLQRLSLRFHGRLSSGDLLRRLTSDTGCVRDLVIGVLLPVGSSVASLVTMFAVMWALDRSLSILAIGFAVPLALAIRLSSRAMTERSYARDQIEGQIMARADQILSTLPTVQAFAREDDEARGFTALTRKGLRAHLAALAAELRFKVSVSSVTAVGTAAVMAVGGLHVIDGTLSVGGLLVVLAYLGSLYAPLETMAYLSGSFAAAAGRARRVFEVLDEEPEVQDAPGARPFAPRAPRRGGHVELEGVTFGYAPGRPVLHGIDLEAHPGETLALVGRTGAGKTTLVSLVPRFFDPWQGSVRLDGQDLRGLQLASLRRQVALVLQEPLLLPLSVAENIAYGRPEASREEIERAAVAAQADAFIRALPQGYDTVLAERGATLSGGEKQRLSIARALLKDAPVLILDEPTSALDAETERLVLAALERLMQGRTTLVIAHRLSTIRGADKIVVLQGGHIIETGSHHELLQAGGAYADLDRAASHSPATTRAAAPTGSGGVR